MSSVPEIIEEPPPEAAVVDESGLKASRRFSILATSQVAAIMRVYGMGITRGSVYRDRDGNVPDPSCRAQSITCNGKPHAPEGGTGLYIVDISYSSQASSSDMPKPGGPAKFRIEGNMQTLQIDYDAEGTPYTNAVQEPLDPPGSALRPNEVLVGRWYIQGEDPLLARARYRQFNGRVNEREFYTAQRGCLFCHGVNVGDPESGYMLAECRWEYRPPFTVPNVANPTECEGWWDVRLHRGRRNPKSTTDPDTGLPIVIYSPIMEPIIDPETNEAIPGRFQPISEPRFLDLDGIPLGVPASGKVTPYIIIRKPYLYADFNQMDIPKG